MIDFRFLPSSFQHRRGWALGQNNRGQIIVEYVLLLAVAVVIAVILTRAMVGRNEAEPGFVIDAWVRILEEIGGDRPDDLKGATP